MFAYGRVLLFICDIRARPAVPDRALASSHKGTIDERPCLQSGGNKGAMPEAGTGLGTARSATSSREIRAHLGKRLRSYHNATQQIALPERMAELVDLLAKQAEELSCKPE
jgi:hypothetical protein